MLDGLITLSTSPTLLIALLVATPIGLIYGIVPGLGGKIAIITMMPFVFAMDVNTGCVFLISLHAVVHTGGAVPSILFGIPGGGPSTAVVLDGYAMARKGEAVRAITASAVASAVGGVLGAVFLAALIPFSLALMRTISYPEIFLLALLGIGLAAALSGEAPIKGLLTGCFGLALSFVGSDPIYGGDRFTLDQPFLWEGVDLVTAVLAIFAIPEMIDLVRNGGKVDAVASADRGGRGQILQGMRDVVVHRWLTLRTSLIGAIIGFVPGLGGDVAAWFCYGHALQTSREPEQFGKGSVEGVIGPEAANNAKEGGALTPTLFLGIPGSSGMAVLLIALAPLGVAPGPSLPVEHPDLLWLMVWALALSNIVGTIALIAATPWINRVRSFDSRILAPFVFLLCLLSVDLSAQDWRFLVLAGGLGMFGYAFKRLGWPRAPFVIGVILGPMAEQSLIKSLEIWGPTFLLRPGSLVIISVALIGMFQLRRRLLSSRTLAAANAR